MVIINDLAPFKIVTGAHYSVLNGVVDLHI